MYINFQQNQVCRSVKTVHTNLFAKYRKFHKFVTTNSNFSKSTFSDMHGRKTYMYINFQQTRASRPVTTVHTNIFANKFKLHKFAICN